MLDTTSSFPFSNESTLNTLRTEATLPITRAAKGEDYRKPFTLHPTPHILHPAPYTLHPAPCTLHPFHTLHLTPYTLHPTPYTLHHTPYTIHHTFCSLHPTPCTLHPAPYTLHHAPYIAIRHLPHRPLPARCRMNMAHIKQSRPDSGHDSSQLSGKCQ